MLSRLKLAKQQIHELEYQTRGQSENPLWKAHQFGQVTASQFGKILTRVSSAGQLVQSLLCGGNLTPLPALAHGSRHEEDARQAYIIKWSEGKTVKVKSAGLHVVENGFLGCSADGLVYEVNSEEHGVLEINCPFSAAEAPLLEVSAKSSHFFAKPTPSGELELKKSHAYYCQIQGSMAILELKWCDFVLWSPCAKNCF